MDVGIVERTTLASAMLPVCIAYGTIDVDYGAAEGSRQIDRSVKMAQSVMTYRNLMADVSKPCPEGGALTVADRLSNYVAWADHIALTCPMSLIACPQVHRAERGLETVLDYHYTTRSPPNYTVYSAAYEILRSPPWFCPGVASSMQLAVKFARLRVVKDQSRLRIPCALDTEATADATFFESVASDLERSFRAALAFKSKVDEEASTKHFDGPSVRAVREAYNRYEGDRAPSFEVLVIGQLVALCYKGREYRMTFKHYTRLVCMFRSFSQVAIMWRDLSARCSCLESICEIVRMAVNCDPSIIDHFPSGLKGAKQVIVAGLDKSHLMSSDPARELLKTYGTEKRGITMAVLRATKFMFKCDISRANFLNMYRSMPHPDYDPVSLFETIEGLHHPNTVERRRLTPFEGRVRRTMFTNLLAQKCRVNVAAQHGFRADSAVMNAIHSLNENNATMAVANSISDLVWSRMVLIADYKNPKMYVLKPENKSSARHISFTEYLTKAVPGDVHCNDLVESAVEGEDKYMNVEDAYVRFVTMIRATLATLGIDGAVVPDELPVTSMSPKFGEYHKFNTRLFYLAERWLKSVLQTFERTCKQLISKQKGVSITKSSRDRRRSVEVMARSLGSSSGKTTAYVSFDMSEFSKKFPVALTRIFTKVIGEVAGDDDISLISEVFRHTFGGFTSDTFVGKIWGIEGGFEGFMNFTWTSIHEVIMQIALDEVGLKGVLETFSDDGILMVHIPDHELSTFHQKAKQIQAVYSEFGLEFQFSKTLVSSNVWEFLGDISIDGKVVPQFIKEAGKAGECRYGKSFSTASATAEALFSQTAAAADHGLSVDLTSVLSHFTILEYIRSFSPNLTAGELFYLVCAPPCMGGFRVPSLTEFAIRGYKSTSSELQADVDIGVSAFGDDFMRVLMNVGSLISVSKDDASCLISSVPVAAAGLSIVSGGVTDDLISLALERCPRIRLATNPMRGALGKALSKAARGATMVTPGILADLVMSSPVMMAYTSSIVFTESNALLKLVGRVAIKRAQARDTRNLRKVHRAISAKRTNNYAPQWGFVDRSLKRSHPGVNFAPTPPSYRVILAPTLEQPRSTDASVVKFSFPSATTYASIGLMESVEEFMPGTSVSLWATEGAPNDPARARARYIDKAAAFLASNPGLEGVINIVAVASGLEPVVDEALFPMSEVRFSAGNHCTYTTYSPLKNATTISLAGAFKSLYEIQGRADRTSHVPNMKLIATSIYMSGMTRNGMHGDSRQVYFIANSEQVIRRHMIPRVKFPGSGVQVYGGCDAFKKAYETEVADAVAMEALATSLFINRAPYDPFLAGCLAAELAAHVGSMMEGSSPTSSGPAIPTCYYPAIEQAIVALVHSKMDPRVRGQFALSRAKARPLTCADSQGHLAFPSHRVQPRFGSGAEFMKARMDPDTDPDYGVTRVIAELSLDERESITRTWDLVLGAMRAVIPELTPENGYISLIDFLEDLAMYAMSHSLFRSTEVVVVNATIGLDGTRTSAIMAAYKRAMTESLADVKMASVSKIIGRKGDVVDCIVAMRASVYPSSHREQAWNNRVAETVYNCFTRVRSLALRDDFGELDKERLHELAATEVRLSVAGSRRLNHDVSERLFEGTMNSPQVTSHILSIINTIATIKPHQVAVDSCHRRMSFERVVQPLSSYLTSTFKVVKPSKLTVFMGSIDRNEGLRRIKGEAGTSNEVLVIPSLMCRGPEEGELMRDDVRMCLKSQRDIVLVVDTHSVAEMIDIVSEAVARSNVQVCVWSTASSEGLVNHVFISGADGSVVVGYGDGLSSSWVASPLVARWVKGILCDGGSGITHIDAVNVTKFIIGTTIDSHVRGHTLEAGTHPDIMGLAALANSCRSVDARLKVLIYMRFYRCINGMSPLSNDVCAKIIKNLACGKDVRLGPDLYVAHGKFMMDVQKTFAYLAACQTPRGTEPISFGDYTFATPIPYSVIWASGGYKCADLRSAEGQLPGSVSDTLWVPDPVRRAITGKDPNDNDSDDDDSDEDGSSIWFSMKK